MKMEMEIEIKMEIEMKMKIEIEMKMELKMKMKMEIKTETEMKMEMEINVEIKMEIKIEMKMKMKKEMEMKIKMEIELWVFSTGCLADSVQPQSSEVNTVGLESFNCPLTLGLSSVFQNASGDPAVSSTVNPLTTKKSKVKTEAEGPLPISPSSQVRSDVLNFSSSPELITDQIKPASSSC